MSLAHGREYLAIPGPSVIPDRVLRAMHRAAPNIYEGELVEITGTALRDLKALAGTAGDCAIYISNGHGMWEAALANTIRPGDRVLVPVAGRFGHGWAELARDLGAEVEILEFPTTAAVDPDRVAEALRADTAYGFRAVLAVLTDTSTGIRSDIAALRRVLDDLGHPALLMADCIASFGCDPFEMDDWGVDVMITASQKGLMTPPGLGFAFFNARAAAARDRLDRVSPYWDWRPRAAPEMFYRYFFGTAPTHHLFALREALDMIAEEGRQAVLDRHATLARALWAACDAWGRGGALALNAADPAIRSHAVTAISLPGGPADRLRAWCAAEAGVTLGIGLGTGAATGPGTGEMFRVGHMGHVNAHMLLGVVGVIEAGLIALDIPHGSGGVEAAARVCAGR
ncbi:alanine--glyoxylate aminotransferase family protein [Palleronia sediminis]|uniref:Alanine--glyoxylate aminotransferase family protein n=1 Tax=Palleronia sediminis TaxID=2547833 RepID=A0A4R6AQJ3_9RHOB|nr:aminotransferase class V-fold PLP-dependent enzyme [Palleronia sediminis]TDL84306.1 alanine--glyoxylate aminotransferase family protein [Palleronia sediminis]